MHYSISPKTLYDPFTQFIQTHSSNSHFSVPIWCRYDIFVKFATKVPFSKVLITIKNHGYSIKSFIVIWILKRKSVSHLRVLANVAARSKTVINWAQGSSSISNRLKIAWTLEILTNIWKALHIMISSFYFTTVSLALIKTNFSFLLITPEPFLVSKFVFLANLLGFKFCRFWVQAL